MMPLRDYFGGIRIELRSPLKPEQVKERINRAASFGLSPFYSGVVGRVWGHSLRLAYRTSILEYNQKPLLVGPVEGIPNGSRLDLSYRAPRAALAFFVLWYALMLFIFGGAAIAVIESREVATGLILAILPVFALTPIAMHYWGTRRWDTELDDLLDCLRLEAEATPLEN